MSSVSHFRKQSILSALVSDKAQVKDLLKEHMDKIDTNLLFERAAKSKNNSREASKLSNSDS